MASSPLLCVFLLSCFTENLPKSQFSLCPDNCDCYSAPKGGNGANTAISVVFKQYPDSLQFRLLSNYNFNTIVLTNVNTITSEFNNSFMDGIAVNNILFDNTVLPKYAIQPFTRVNSRTLNVLTFLNTNFDSNGLDIDWRLFSAFVNLQAIHIENGSLTRLDNNFEYLSSNNILTATFDNNRLNYIKPGVFKEWVNLKMLTIINNLIIDVFWLSTELPLLWYLNLNNNQISSLKYNLAQLLPSLKVLKVDNNKLRIISWDTISPLVNNLRELSFSGNVMCANYQTDWLQNEYKNGTDAMSSRYPLFYYDSLSDLQIVTEFYEDETFKLGSQLFIDDFVLYRGDCSEVDYF